MSAIFYHLGNERQLLLCALALAGSWYLRSAVVSKADFYHNQCVKPGARTPNRSIRINQEFTQYRHGLLGACTEVAAEDLMKRAVAKGTGNGQKIGDG